MCLSITANTTSMAPSRPAISLKLSVLQGSTLLFSVHCLTFFLSNVSKSNTSIITKRSTFTARRNVLLNGTNQAFYNPIIYQHSPFCGCYLKMKPFVEQFLKYLDVPMERQQEPCKPQAGFSYYHFLIP